MGSWGCGGTEGSRSSFIAQNRVYCSVACFRDEKNCTSLFLLSQQSQVQTSHLRGAARPTFAGGFGAHLGDPIPKGPGLGVGTFLDKDRVRVGRQSRLRQTGAPFRVSQVLYPSRRLKNGIRSGQSRPSLKKVKRTVGPCEARATETHADKLPLSWTRYAVPKPSDRSSS